MNIEFILLAAGKGKRTLSDLPKVLLPLGGKPMLFHIIEQMTRFRNSNINLVIGHDATQVKTATEDFCNKLNLSPARIRYVNQKEQRGTGHAVAVALKKIPAKEANNSLGVVMYGDVPLIRDETIKAMIQEASPSKQQEVSAVWLTAHLENPTGYGRIVRNTFGRPIGIVEEKDCKAEQRKIKEINTGILAAPLRSIKPWLNRMLRSKPQSAQGEYLLTDLMHMAYQEDHNIGILTASDREEFLGANDMWQLTQLERIVQKRRAEDLAKKGVYLRDPQRLDILGEVKTGKGVKIGVNVILRGKISIGKDVEIGNNCLLENCSIGDGTTVKDFCYIQDAKVGKRCTLGPYTRLRPGTDLGEEVKLGNFVEVKNSKLKQGAQVSHLSYIGDTHIGTNTNIGAGVITCNYDGIDKHKTVIKDNSFIGSNTSLVAPLTIGKDSIVGAGSTITKDVKDGSLALTRAPQRSYTDMARRKHKVSSATAKTKRNK